MKKAKNLVLVSLAVVAFAACKKEDEDKLSKKDMLTAGSWIQTDYLQGGSSMWSSFDNCEKDDFYTLKADGTGTFDEGPTKCDPDDPQTESILWALSSDESKLTIDGSEGTISELTSTSLILKSTVFGITFESRYKKK